MQPEQVQCFQLLRSPDQASGQYRRQQKFPKLDYSSCELVLFPAQENPSQYREAPDKIKVAGNNLLLSSLRPKSKAHQQWWEAPLASPGFGTKPQHKELMGMKFWKHGGG